MDEQQGLTAKRVHALRHELLQVDVALRGLIDGISGIGAPHHLLEAAKTTLGFSDGPVAALKPVVDALRREERPLEQKVRELEDKLDGFTEPKDLALREVK